MNFIVRLFHTQWGIYSDTTKLYPPGYRVKEWAV